MNNDFVEVRIENVNGIVHFRSKWEDAKKIISFFDRNSKQIKFISFYDDDLLNHYTALPFDDKN